MAITKSIVDLMNGTITVQTEQGKGTTFTVQLKLPFAEDVPEEMKEGLSAEKAEAADFSGMRLLLVEDNAVNREIATMILQTSGFILETAENGRLAAERVETSPPGYYQAVLMDIQMPVMNGYDATRAIRALPDPVQAAVPIIAMTANAFTEDMEEAKNAGMNAHIAKPLDVAKMLATLAEVLKKN
ncbi:MAG: response regulator [Lachnospiraceae bacterium]|nr:response regulator [Lachnospiraceae bacterium]